MAAPPLVSIQKMKLSGSTDGRFIRLNTNTFTSSASVHVATSNANGIDLVTLYAVNASTVAVKVTLGWGGTTDPDDLIEVTVPPESGLFQITDRLPIANSLGIRGFGSIINSVMITGFVDRMIYS